MTKKTLHRQNVVACIWDFDKTLIPGYMQAPIFAAYGIDAEAFWREVNDLPAIYAERGTYVSKDTIYLNHLISFIKNGDLKGLTARLRELGKQLDFYPGVIELFNQLKEVAVSKPEYQKHNIQLEHYIISTGLAEMIRGSAIAPHVDGIFACESKHPCRPITRARMSCPCTWNSRSARSARSPTTQSRLASFSKSTRAVSKPQHRCQRSIERADRRIPIDRMIYTADGPSDVPVFSVLKQRR